MKKLIIGLIVFIILFSTVVIIPKISRGSTEHAPIRIESNDDFQAQGWPGSGSQLDPWIIEDLDIDGSTEHYCIYIANTTDYWKIQDCVLHDATSIDHWEFYGNAALVLNNVENGQVHNNEVYNNNGSGITIGRSTKITISNNEVYANGNGIHLTSASSDNEICDNDIYENVHGFAIDWQPNNNTIMNNHIRYSTDDGIYCWGAVNNNTFDGNIIEQHVFNEENLAIRSISFGGSPCNGNIFTNNTLERGIEISGSYNLIKNNNLGTGLRIDDSYNVVDNNVYSGGISLWWRATNNTISNNTGTNGKCGVEMWGSSYNIVKDNNFVNNYCGVSLRTDTEWNRIYHNNFINNTVQAIDDGDNNAWSGDKQSGGNYWSTYTGQDKNNDGIGDDPYTYQASIGNAIDWYPLMEPYNGQYPEPSYQNDNDYFLYSWLIIIIIISIIIIVTALIMYIKKRKSLPPPE